MVSYVQAEEILAAHYDVLILVVVDDGLVQNYEKFWNSECWTVLILVVMEDGLVLPSSYILMDSWDAVLILVVMEDGLVPTL